MYAVVKTGGKQYRVENDQKLLVDRLKAEEGSIITLNNLLMVVENGKISTGKALENIAVSATVLKQTRGSKIITLKHRRRKNSRKTIGHRQDLTLLKVVGIGDPKKLVIKETKPKMKSEKSGSKGLEKDKVDEKNKIELKIEDYQLEIDEIKKQIPENWTPQNKEFEIIQKAKNTQTKRYKKNVDQAYDNLDQIVMFINDHDKLNDLSSEINNLKRNIDNADYENSISIIDSLFEKLGEISGSEEIANKLDDLYSLVDSEEKDLSKISDASYEVNMLFKKEVSWRKDASKNLMPEIAKYNSIIKNNIGLRLQSKLTKEQAKFVARCNSIHRDISLNF